ncbi:MAG: MarR family winged helix-turn-helix transcriptional regulator [Planctomycetales bacterium]
MNRKLTLEDRLARALRQINRAVDLHSRALLQQHGLTAPQLATLLDIERMQPVSTGVLATELHMGSATLTGILDRLEERGLVCRTRHAGDRRSVLLSLTDLGTQLFASAPSQLCAAFSKRLAVLPEWEQTSILSTLQRVATMMEPCAAEADSSAEGPARYATPGSTVDDYAYPAYGASNPSVPKA